MIFYELETKIGLLSIYSILVLSAYLFFIRRQEKKSLYLLVGGSLCLRLLMCFLDPYLHEWDERFHALVAKNMMDNPLRPMLYTQPVIDYNYESWCCNHIWLHKQPLFLWQMALSMGLFGVNEIALRLPSALLGTLSIPMIYQIVQYWSKEKNIAFITAFLAASFFYHLELISGRYGMEHNDLAFYFYLTASIWAWTKYWHLKDIKWAIGVGCFVGCAIMNKWLTGLLVYAGWSWMQLIHPQLLKSVKIYGHFSFAIISSLMVALPWQLYISIQFPEESAWEYQLNARHVTEVIEGHSGDAFFYINKMNEHYGIYLCIFLILGLIIQIFRIAKNKEESSLLVMGILFFSFFNFIVKSKVSGFLFPISAFFFMWIAIGLHQTIQTIHPLKFINKIPIRLCLFLTTTLWGVYLLSFNNVARYRADDNIIRNEKIANTQTFKNLDLPHQKDKQLVLFNTKTMQQVELMFYQDCSAYAWFPKQEVFEKLEQNQAYTLMVFPNHNEQVLPSYILKSTNTKILNPVIK